MFEVKSGVESSHVIYRGTQFETQIAMTNQR